MADILEAQWAETCADADGDTRYWLVGKPVWVPQSGQGPIITRITVQTDLPGLHCDMRRVCVWVGDELVAEAPVINLQAIGYAMKEAK